MLAPMTGSVATENQRTSTLSGANAEVPQSDSSMAGIVVELIAKLADNSDAMDDQPEGGSSGDGAAMASGQDTAREGAADAKDQGTEHSQENREFLDQAARAEQEESVATNITSLEGRAREEEAIRDGIQLQKAQHLLNMNAAKDRCVTESTMFSEQFTTMDAWRQDWDTKKAAVDALY